MWQYNAGKMSIKRVSRATGLIFQGLLVNTRDMPLGSSGGGAGLPRVVCFGPFELNIRSGELRKHGIKIRLHQQPLQVLLMLLSHPGEVVLREEIRKALWPDDTVVEFDHGINAAIQRLRDALGDSAENPRYVETLPRRGYRFPATVESTGSVLPGTAPPQPHAEAIPGLESPDLSGKAMGPPTEAVSLHKRNWWVAAGVTFVLFVAAGGWWWARHARSSQPGRFERLSFRRGVIQCARFTPDGRSVIYAASWEGQPLDLYSQQLGSVESRPLGLPSTGLLAVAATGEMAVLTNCDLRSMNSLGTLAEMPLSGGAPREILERAQFADWTKDGKRLAVTVAGETSSRLEFPRGHVLFQASGTGWPGDPRVSPNGELVAFADHYYIGNDGAVAIVDLQGRKRTLTRVFDTLQGLAWTPSGREIWFTASEGGLSNRRLYAVTLSGAMRVVAQSPANLKLHDIAADGRVLLTKDDSPARIYFVGPKDSTPRDLTWLTWAVIPVLSADGKTLLMTENDEATGGKNMIYLRGTDGSPAIRLGDNFAVSLSPDGRWVVATGAPVGKADIKLLPVRAGAPVPMDTGSLQLTGGILPNMPRVAWFPDSQRILFPAREPGREARAFIQDIRGGQPHPVTPEGIWGSVLTTDGALLLVRDSRSNAFLFPIEGGAPKPLPFLTPGYKELSFSTDGRSLYVTRAGERPPRVWRVDLGSGRMQVWREIPFSDPAVIVMGIQITSDGESLAYSFRKTLSELYVVHGLR